MLAVGPMGLGPFELVLILLVVVLIFGVGKMADIGGAFGKSIREFRKAAREPDESESLSSAETDVPSAGPVACTKCDAKVASGLKFCGECGAPVEAAVS